MSSTGIIFDIKQYAIHDGPGIRTTVFFKGCPLNCSWCHNPESRSAEPETMPAKGSCAAHYGRPKLVGEQVTPDYVMSVVCKDVLFYEESGGGVTFSGGEPMQQTEFLSDLLSTCREAGISTAVDTSGYAEWSDLERVAELTDLFLYDIKLFDSDEHLNHVGVDNELILSNLKRLTSNHKRVNVRIPMIPGITDTLENIDSIAQFLLTAGEIELVSLLPYNRFRRDKVSRLALADRLDGLVPANADEQDLSEAADLLERLGFRVKIGG